MLLFATGLYDTPGWKKYGYWISMVLIIVFAMGGAVIRTSGGKLSLLSLGLILIAALLNTTGSKPPTV